MADIFELFKKISTASPVASEPVSYLIVGLGNPGDDYKYTRHNAGFLALDYIAQKSSVSVNRLKYKSLVGDTVISGKRVLLMKPQTFMNKSGEAVVEAAGFYKIQPENVIVLCDDVNFDAGKLRIRKKGSDGGQRGMRSIIELSGSDAFPRIKLGVGKKPTPEYDMADWVLSKFSSEEQEKLFSAIEKAYEAVTLILDGKLESAMSKFN